MPGDGNGAYWDGSDDALYIVDDANAMLVRWADDGGFANVAGFPAGEKLGLGGLARTPGGFGWVATSFGGGSAGGVYTLSSPGSTASAIPKLDPARRRLGITVSPSGAIFDAYFVVAGHDHTGGVARLDLANGGETDIVTTGLHKPVGVAATATTLYVTDQQQNTLLAYPLTAEGSAGAPTTIAKDLPSADLLTLLPNGDLVTGGKRGGVYRITPAGAVTTIADGMAQVRGTAYDPAGKRLFVIEHAGKGGPNLLHIIPLDGGGK